MPDLVSHFVRLYIYPLFCLLYDTGVNMGACLGKENGFSLGRRRGSLRKSTTDGKELQVKIKAALALSIEEQAKLPHQMTLERILLKFDKLQDVLGYVKDVFTGLSENGDGLDAAKLETALKNLKGKSSPEEVREVFNFSDLEGNKKVDLKEFMVALTVAIALEKVNFGTENIKLAPSPRRQSISSFFGHPKEVYNMLKLIISAYLLFDPEGRGFIEKQQVQNLLKESGSKGGSNAILTNERWNELDWDEDGTIDLAEFINAFTHWVDVDNVLEFDD